MGDGDGEIHNSPKIGGAGYGPLYTDNHKEEKEEGLSASKINFSSNRIPVRKLRPSPPPQSAQKALGKPRKNKIDTM